MSWLKLGSSYLLEWHEPKNYVKSHAFERLAHVSTYMSFVFVFSLFSVMSIIWGANDYFPFGLLISFGGSFGVIFIACLMVFIPRYGAISSEGVLVDGAYIKFETIDSVSIDERNKDNEEYNVLIILYEGMIQHEIAVDKGEFTGTLISTLKKLPVTIN